MINKEILEITYNKLLSGDISCLDINTSTLISEYSVSFLEKQMWDNFDKICVDLILRISNIAYNNTSLEILPLDDGVYDQLLQLYKQYNPNYQIGALPIQFNEVPQNEFNEMKIMCTHLTKDEEESKLYIRDIINQYSLIDPRYKTMCYKIQDPISKRIINTPHKYPELVGTLDKCKFVLNQEAIDKQVFDKQSVQIFERDFIHKCLTLGVINSVEQFEMVGELKYDGISVEADVCGDTIISARSRGDTGEDIATDLTPILGGYKFPRAKDVPTDQTFGIKFEAIITKRDLNRMAELRNKKYANCRNAIIGLFGSSDAYKYRDFITLIPLATSLDMPRITELDFLNKYYSSGEFNRYVVMKGDYKQILFQVKQFTESAEIVRKILPYLIDGVVISFTDNNKINMLGRKNSVNKYSIAIKFNPKRVRTIFLGYTFSIGKTGDVIPMVHFKPCEFMGNIQTKQTLHSYKRFMELGLHKGDQIDIEYRNDVLTYVDKPNTEYNRNNSTLPLEPFIDICPYCGSKIVISESGKSAKCPNYNCPERSVQRAVDMLVQLKFKDFSEESVRALGIKSFKDLMNITYEQCLVLGSVNALNFMDRLNTLKTSKIDDFKIMSALGFSNIGVETWKIILHELSIKEILELPYDDLYRKLVSLNSIGNTTANLICNDRSLYVDDINIILNMNNIVSSKGKEYGKRVVITGNKDPELINLLLDNGFDVSEKYSLTKNTYCLITNDKNSTSGKMVKAKKYGIPIMTIQEFLDYNSIKL